MSIAFYRRWRPIGAISFDLDDTLYDNLPVMYAAERAVHDFIVKQYPQSKHWSIGDWSARRHAIMQRDNTLASDMTALRIATLTEGLRELGIAQPEQHARVVMAEFLRHRNAVTIGAEVHQVLHDLSQVLPLYALSNGNVNIPAIGLAHYFQATWQPASQLRGKPHLDMFNAAAAAEPKLKPWQWLHVGDSPTADILGAHRAGWQSAWYRHGIYSAEQLQVLPTLAFSSLRELADFILVAYTVTDQ